jgi:hypothetical protein
MHSAVLAQEGADLIGAFVIKSSPMFLIVDVDTGSFKHMAESSITNLNIEMRGKK